MPLSEILIRKEQKIFEECSDIHDQIIGRNELEDWLTTLNRETIGKTHLQNLLKRNLVSRQPTF